MKEKETIHIWMNELNEWTNIVANPYEKLSMWQFDFLLSPQQPKYHGGGIDCFRWFVFVFFFVRLNEDAKFCHVPTPLLMAWCDEKHTLLIRH